MYRPSSYSMYINKMHKILVIRLYFPLDARRMVPAYTKCDVQLIKVAPDDGLTQSETCRASNGK